MLDAFIVSFRLRKTYRVNGIIYSLKSIPLIRKLLPSSLYANRGLKIFANIISGILELLSLTLGKFLYLLLICLASFSMEAPRDESFVHIIIFMSIIGLFLNTQMFDPSKDKFYAIFCMRMNAKLYALSNYFYFILKTFAGFLVFTLIFGLMCNVKLIICLMIPLYVTSLKLCCTALTMNSHLKPKKNILRTALIRLSIIAVLFLAAVIPPLFGYTLNSIILLPITAILIITALISLRYIIRYNKYREIYKIILTPDALGINLPKNTINVSQQTQMHKKISDDTSLTSSKSGYQYFNEIFMKRHSKLLTKSAKIITVVSVILFIIFTILCLNFENTKEEINDMMLTSLPYFLFVMYFVNRGKVITQAMFMNCDHSMLSYRFYRQPKTILSLFIARLKYVIIINLIPGSVIAVGLPALLFITGGTEQPLNYLVLFVSIISMSVFFSVHNMVLYYLLQPYNIELETKSYTYGIVNTITYLICYLAVGKEMPTLIFGSVISAFCIIYIIVSLILAYRLAPKTFKLR